MKNVVAPPDAILTQTPTADLLNGFVGKNIKDICDCGYHNNSDNHCAHFVSHALGFHFGYTCKHQTGKGQIGANIKVQQLFAKCQAVGNWEDREKKACLVFVTDESNVELETQEMENAPKKHVGIFLNDTIWHYSNSKMKVVTQTPQAFSHHYPGPNIALFYGDFPL